VGRHPNVVGIFGEFVGSPIFFAVKRREAKLMDRMAIEPILVPIDKCVMSVDPHSPVVMRD